MEERVNYIEGAVDTVVYQNEENGYTVLRLDVGGEEPVTVVGCIPGVARREPVGAGELDEAPHLRRAIQGRGGPPGHAPGREGHL